MGAPSVAFRASAIDARILRRYQSTVGRGERLPVQYSACMYVYVCCADLGAGQ